MRENYELNLCGIDEAGRGPFAGPLVVAGVILNEPIEELNDSKKLTEKKREALFEIIKQRAEFHIVFKSSAEIDKFGISKCLSESIKEIMKALSAKQYLMDGNTAFGINKLNYLIKADGLIDEVSAASILAKVSRDRYMYEIAAQYPQYLFEKHKGYGTKAHIEAIKTHGFSKIHRKSFKIKQLEGLNIKEPSLFD